MVTLASVQTFSGLFAFLALVAVLNRCLTLGGLLLTVAGAAGLGVFWERWSLRTGYEVEVRARHTGKSGCSARTPSCSCSV